MPEFALTHDERTDIEDQMTLINQIGEQIAKLINERSKAVKALNWIGRSVCLRLAVEGLLDNNDSPERFIELEPLKQNVMIKNGMVSWNDKPEIMKAAKNKGE